MNTPRCTLSGLLALVVLLLSACGKGDQAPEPMAIDQAAEQVKSTFSGASQEVRAVADGAAKSMQEGDYVDTYQRLEALSAQGDLTPEQRRKLGETQSAVLRKMSEAAESGDANAAKALEMHRARK
jgi:hypothetical protein